MENNDNRLSSLGFGIGDRFRITALSSGAKFIYSIDDMDEYRVLISWNDCGVGYCVDYDILTVKNQFYYGDWVLDICDQRRNKLKRLYGI